MFVTYFWQGTASMTLILSCWKCSWSPCFDIFTLDVVIARHCIYLLLQSIKYIFIKINEMKFLKLNNLFPSGNDVLLLSSSLLLREVSHTGRCLDHQSVTTDIEYQDIGYKGNTLYKVLDKLIWLFIRKLMPVTDSSHYNGPSKYPVIFHRGRGDVNIWFLILGTASLYKKEKDQLRHLL